MFSFFVSFVLLEYFHMNSADASKMILSVFIWSFQYSVICLFNVDFNINKHQKLRLSQMSLDIIPTFRSIADRTRSLRQVLLFVEGYSNCKLKYNKIC